jgi:hypothetical protein
MLEITKRLEENRSKMMTSNRCLDEWGKRLRDAPAASCQTSRGSNEKGSALPMKILLKSG